MNDVGYMQVHLRVYAKSELYDSFAINAEDGCYKLETNLVSSHHEIIDDPAKIGDKVFQINLKIFDTGSSITLHMPIHQSTEWEVVKGSEIYTIGFYCNLGELGRKVVEVMCTGVSMECLSNTEIYEVMRVLANEYISEIDLPKTVDLINRGEAEGDFPAGKWLLHDLDISCKNTGKLLSPEHAKLYRQLCEYCI